MTFLLLTVWFLLTEHELFLQGSFIHRYLGLYIKFLHFSLRVLLSLSLLLSLKLINTGQLIKELRFGTSLKGTF